MNSPTTRSKSSYDIAGDVLVQTGTSYGAVGDSSRLEFEAAAEALADSISLRVQ